VLAVSVDGLNPDAITELGPGRTPAFHRLMRDGAWTLNARTEQELTITLPNHTGMLTGRRVAEKDGGHGVTFNVDNGKTVHRAAGEYVASVFDVVHDNGGQTALFSAKEKFAFFARTWNAAGAPDRAGADNGRKKIDRVVLDTDNARLVRTLDADVLSTPREFTFLHISLPDVAGHAHGFMGKDYLKAVEQTDLLLGRVLATVESRPATAGRMLVVVTADHGGLGSNHSDPTRLADYRIPFLAWGPGVPKGKDLYALNPTFLDPGRSRPGYNGPQPIRNGDVANLVTDVLDLPAVPGSSLDRPQTLTVLG
jgi:predicted AlkP superfamily pyrophosphatase or phosphodiesterase